MRIDLTDNNGGLGAAACYRRDDVVELFPLADQSVADLCRVHERLLVFPYCLDEAYDDIGKESVLNMGATADADWVRLVTNNVMGFFGVGDLQVKIQSRFDVGRHDFLLHYLLQRVQGYNLFDLNYNQEQEDVFDFLLYLFPYLLNAALRQGLYREYRQEKHNDANLNGVLDVSRHVAKNVPFVGNFAYSTRNFSYDNALTELIRHTIEFMRSKRLGRAVLRCNEETLQNVALVVEHTPGYVAGDRAAVIGRNLRFRVHPFFTEYGPLQTLCLQILRLDQIRYGEADREVCGILVDGAWLWEEYVNTVLAGRGFVHAENKRHRGGIRLFADGSGVRYPDFYKVGQMVLDAKYKRFERFDEALHCWRPFKQVSEVPRDDVHQVVTYMHALKAPRGGFVAPMNFVPVSALSANLKDRENEVLSVFGIGIDDSAASYAEFCARMRVNEERFLQLI